MYKDERSSERVWLLDNFLLSDLEFMGKVFSLLVLVFPSYLYSFFFYFVTLTLSREANFYFELIYVMACRPV